MQDGALSECIRAPWECHRRNPLDRDCQLPQSQQSQVGPLSPSQGQSAGSRARVWAKARPPLGPSPEVDLTKCGCGHLHWRLEAWWEGRVGNGPRTLHSPRPPTPLGWEAGPTSCPAWPGLLLALHPPTLSLYIIYNIGLSLSLFFLSTQLCFFILGDKTP